MAKVVREMEQGKVIEVDVGRGAKRMYVSEHSRFWDTLDARVGDKVVITTVDVCEPDAEGRGGGVDHQWIEMDLDVAEELVKFLVEELWHVEPEAFEELIK